MMYVFAIIGAIIVAVCVGAMLALSETEIDDCIAKRKARKEEKLKAEREAEKEQWLYEAAVESGI